MQIELNAALKGIPPGATDIAVAVLARGLLLQLINETNASRNLKNELDECAKRISEFISATSGKS